MNENIIEKLKELENNPEFIEKTAAAGSADEMLAVLGEFGIQLAEADLKDLLAGNAIVSENGELSEDALDNISGGGFWDWLEKFVNWRSDREGKKIKKITDKFCK